MTSRNILVIVIVAIVLAIASAVILGLVLAQDNDVVGETGTADEAESTDENTISTDSSAQASNSSAEGAAAASGRSSTITLISEPVVRAALEASKQSGFADPYQVEWPPAEDPDGILAWFQADGQPLVTMFVQVAGFWADEDLDCYAATAVLDGLGTPAELRGLIAEVPDEVTEDLMGSVYFAAVNLLGHCVDGLVNRDTPSYGDYAWQWVVAHRRLTELGVVSE